MKALYRRYRPKALSEVVGQEQVTNTLSKSLKDGKVSHAYIFIGPRGTGKTSVARIFAHEINQFQYELEDDYLDIIEIDAASNTGVDNIRDIREKALIAPTQGKYKVYIIDEVHMLSKAAFNALLKLLEEPPEHVVFIMATTDAHKIPITITSRSQVYTFHLADPGVMFNHIKEICKKEKFNIADDALQIIVKRGGGSFRDTLSLLDQISTLSDGEINADILNNALGLPPDELIVHILNSYAANNIDEIRNTLQQITDTGIKTDTIVDTLVEQILANPQPVWLPLLDKIIEVKQSAYPEVKLLLALTMYANAPVAPNQAFQPAVQAVTKAVEKPAEKSAKQAATPVVANAEQTTPPSDSREVANAPEEIPPVETATLENNPEEIPPIEAAALENMPEEIPVGPDQPSAVIADQPISDPVSAAPATSGDLWMSILDYAKTNLRSIHSYLANADYEIKDDKLLIYAGTEFKKKSIEKKRTDLATIAQGFAIEVSSESKQNDDSDIAAIAELMGGGEGIVINE